MPLPVIYIDLLFFVNAAVDYALIICTAKICGVCPERKRFILSALSGAAYSAAAVFLPALTRLPAIIAAGVLMSALAFGAGKGFFRVTLVFFAVSAAFGGTVCAVSVMRGVNALSIRALIISLALCYAVFSAVFRRLARAEVQSLISPVTLTLQGRSITVNALHDTGNSLSEPVTGRPVIVIERESAARLLTKEQASLFTGPVCEAAETVIRAGRVGLRVHLVPYSAVGASGLLPAFRVDMAVIGKKSRPEIFAAVSPTALSDGGGYNALIGGKIY